MSRQSALARGEAETFHLWVFSDAHVATDRAVSAAIRNGMGFIPPAGYPESLANALRQSEEGGELGGPAFRWDIALDLGDNAGLWDLPNDEQGVEVVRQLGVLKEHRREQIYPVAGNHDASPGAAASSQGKPANWWFRKWIDPVGEHPETSGVDPRRRPYPTNGSWERYAFKVGNLRFLMMSDRNDLPYPVGRQESGGGSPAGAVTGETWEWWKNHVAEARSLGENRRQRAPSHAAGKRRSRPETTRAFRVIPTAATGTVAITASMASRKAPPTSISSTRSRRRKSSSATSPRTPGAVDIWLGGHTHTYPDDVVSGRSHVERKWGVNFVNCAQLSKYHSFVTCPPMSRHFTFTAGSPLVRVRCYLHDDSYASQGWYAPAERVLELSKPFAPTPVR